MTEATRGTTEVSIEVKAAGHVSWKRKVVPNVDRVLEVSLRRLPRSKPSAPPAGRHLGAPDLRPNPNREW